MKHLLLILIALFGFSACTKQPEQKTRVQIYERNITKLQTWGNIPKVPNKAKIDRPMAIRDICKLEQSKRKHYVAVRLTQLVEASTTSLTTRNMLQEAIDGLQYYEYVVKEWNKAYDKNVTR